MREENVGKWRWFCFFRPSRGLISPTTPCGPQCFSRSSFSLWGMCSPVSWGTKEAIKSALLKLDLI